MNQKKSYEIKIITEDIKALTYKFFYDLVLVGIILGAIIYIIEKI